jgi:hypothetical protein
MTIGCIMYHLNGNYLLWLQSVTLERLSPKVPTKSGHFGVYTVRICGFCTKPFAFAGGRAANFFFLNRFHNFQITSRMYVFVKKKSVLIF